MSLRYKVMSVSYDDQLVRIRVYEEGTEPSEGQGLDFPVPNPLSDEAIVLAAGNRIRQYLATLPPTPEEDPVTIVGVEQTFEP